MADVVGKNTVSGELLRGFVERVENIDAQKSQLSDDRKVVLAEAKSQGFIPSGIAAVVKLRKMRPSERQEAEAILDTYMHALGEATDTPLFRSVGMMSVDIASREQVIEALKKFVPASGSITVEAGGLPIRMTRSATGDISVTEVRDQPDRQRGKASGVTPTKKADVPDVDADGAQSLGKAAFLADMPIISNPFPFGDQRRPRWDKGWRDASGTDGMDD